MTEKQEDDFRIKDMEEKDLGHRHVTGQEFCEAIRLFALEQYGYMANTVLINGAFAPRATWASWSST